MNPTTAPYNHHHGKLLRSPKHGNIEGIFYCLQILLQISPTNLTDLCSMIRVIWDHQQKLLQWSELLISYAVFSVQCDLILPTYIPIISIIIQSRLVSEIWATWHSAKVTCMIRVNFTLLLWFHEKPTLQVLSLTPLFFELFPSYISHCCHITSKAANDYGVGCI